MQLVYRKRASLLDVRGWKIGKLTGTKLGLRWCTPHITLLKTPSCYVKVCIKLCLTFHIVFSRLGNIYRYRTTTHSPSLLKLTWNVFQVASDLFSRSRPKVNLELISSLRIATAKMRFVLILGTMFVTMAVTLPFDPKMQSRNPVIGYITYEYCNTVPCNTQGPCEIRHCGPCDFDSSTCSDSG